MVFQLRKKNYKFTVGDTHGNIIVVPEGHQLGGSKDGECIQVEDEKGKQTAPENYRPGELASVCRITKVEFEDMAKEIETSGVDGVLGMDFLKNHIIYLNFKKQVAYIL